MGEAVNREQAEAAVMLYEHASDKDLQELKSDAASCQGRHYVQLGLVKGRPEFDPDHISWVNVDMETGRRIIAAAIEIIEARRAELEMVPDDSKRRPPPPA